MKRRRVSSRTVATMKPALVVNVQRHRLLTVLSALLFALLVIFAFLVSSRHVLHPKQDAQTAKNDYRVYTFDVVNEYDHDSFAFTQGLVYAGNDTLYESTGMYRSSSVRKVHVQSGKVLQLHQMEDKYFGEGLTLLDHRLFQVAWRITSGFIYDTDTLSRLGSFRHPMKDGWGLATDGKVIFGSDGTSTIYVMQPSTFKEEKRFLVKDQNKEITQLNELEYVDGELWANVWMTDCIVRISPLNGQVLGWILLHELKSNLLARSYKGVDVLNGIAWDNKQNRLFVTGKYWPKLYEIKPGRIEGQTSIKREMT
ncbi:hypothetical protein GOP47_0012108 [Adiantum capillus-veneris]|uniref:Glutamine cyclotransferase n=1 Tax=Adiantum capillus-veneris TaxID=13818 RepID=A0A9D4UQK2_ADICA|nr:hypothetical protein GOP47_0012108 [Adiantum capillus-veneris]